MPLPRKRFLGLALTVIAAVLLSPFLFKLGVHSLNNILGRPDLSVLDDYQPIGSIEIYDFQDNFVGVLQGKEDRQVVKLTQISDYMKKAVLAAEDNDFFHHGGFSVEGFFRALGNNLKAGRIVQGGSTLTQQMVKNLFIREDERAKRSIMRKVRELLIAIEVEDKYDKDRILEIYLNQVYFGNRAYGIERASQRYFGKSASKLDLHEAAYLAGLLTAPSYLANNLEDAQGRQKYVLRQMRKHGYITEEEFKEAKEKELEFKKAAGNLSKFPYYFSLVEQELRKRFTPNELRKTGLKVYTGLDPVAQRLAINALELGVKNAPPGINQGALVSVDVETAEVRALVGGVGNFWDFQYNRATNPHTIGSGIKPFVYLTAFIKGVVDPNTIILDERLKIPDISSPTGYWSPKNFDDEYHGQITAKAALIFSRNVPAVRVAMKAGIDNIIDTAHKAGITAELKPLLSLALGAQAIAPFDIATAYATLARGGVYMPSVVIRKITDASGKLLEKNVAVPKSALPEAQVGQLVEVMQDVPRYGTGVGARIPGRVMAGKTGTADGGRDIWFTGFTPETVTTVWQGNENNKEVYSRYATGGSTPAWTWREFMTAYLKERPRPVRSFSFTSDYITVMIDPLTGLLATEYTPQPVAKRFKAGTEPKRYSPTPETSEIYTRKGLDKRRRYYRRFDEEDANSKEDEKLKIRKREQEYLMQRRKKVKPSIEIIPKPKSFRINEE